MQLKRDESFTGETEVLMAPSEFVNEDKFRDIDDLMAAVDYEEIERRNKSGRFISEDFGAFQDTYKYLKHQVDFNYVQYKDQLRSLPDRQNKVKSDLMKSIWLVIVMGLIPVIYLIILMWLRNSDITGLHVIYMILLIFVGPVLFIALIAMTPPAFRELNNRFFRYKVLNNFDTEQRYIKKNKIITFDAEKAYLKKKIMEFDDFYQEDAIQGYGTADGNEAKFAEDLDALSERRKNVIEKMREMSVMKENMASLEETRKEVGLGWLMIGVIIAITVAVIYVTCFLGV